MLALVPLALTGPPEPRRLAPQVVADRLGLFLADDGEPVALRPVEALTRPRSRVGYGEVRTVEYRCDSADEVRAVAVTDTAGRAVYRMLPMDEHRISHDGAAPVLVCDGVPRVMLALLMATGGADAAPSAGALGMLLMTRTAPADRPTAIGATPAPRKPEIPWQESSTYWYPRLHRR